MVHPKNFQTGGPMKIEGTLLKCHVKKAQQTDFGGPRITAPWHGAYSALLCEHVIMAFNLRKFLL